jgi:hypothetical protein
MLAIQTRRREAAAANLRDPPIFSLRRKPDDDDQRAAVIDLGVESTPECSRSDPGHDPSVGDSAFEARADGSIEPEKEKVKLLINNHVHGDPRSSGHVMA